MIDNESQEMYLETILKIQKKKGERPRDRNSGTARLQ